MADPTNIDEALDSAALEPARAREGSIEVQQRSAQELIELDKHAARKEASKNPLAKLTRARIQHGKPGGLP